MDTIEQSTRRALRYMRIAFWANVACIALGAVNVFALGKWLGITSAINITAAMMLQYRIRELMDLDRIRVEMVAHYEQEQRSWN